MKKLIHLVLAVLPAATFADEWLEGGRPPAAPSAVVSAGAADNLGDHTATNTLQLGTNVVDFSGMGQLDLYAGLIRGYASGNLTNRLQLQGSPAALVGAWKYDLDAAAVDDSAELVNYRTATNLIRALAGADNLGSHLATTTLDLQQYGISNASGIYLSEGPDTGWTLGAQYGGPAAFYQAELAGGNPFDVVGLYPWNASDGDVLAYNAGNDTWQPAVPRARLAGGPDLATTFQPQQFHFWNVQYAGGVSEVYSQAYVAALGVFHWYYTNGVGTVYAIKQARLVTDPERSGYGTPEGVVTNPAGACWLWGSADPMQSPGFPVAWSYDPAGRGDWYFDGAGVETAGYYVSNIVSSVQAVGVGTQEFRFVNGSLVGALPNP